jgi:hypothetical protein
LFNVHNQPQFLGSLDASLPEPFDAFTLLGKREGPHREKQQNRDCWPDVFAGHFQAGALQRQDAAQAFFEIGRRIASPNRLPTGRRGQTLESPPRLTVENIWVHRAKFER